MNSRNCSRSWPFTPSPVAPAHPGCPAIRWRPAAPSHLIRAPVACGLLPEPPEKPAQVGLSWRTRVWCVSEAGADSEAITMIRLAETEISDDLHVGLQLLLQECFAGYP